LAADHHNAENGEDQEGIRNKGHLKKNKKRGGIKKFKGSIYQLVSSEGGRSARGVGRGAKREGGHLNCISRGNWLEKEGKGVKGIL